VDVAIVGGGYTGLWTALAVRELEPSARVAVLEAALCGEGPSGRNGGFLHGYWSSLAQARRVFGDGGALAVAEAASAIVPGVREFVEQRGVGVWLREAPMLEVSAAPAQDEAIDAALAGAVVAAITAAAAGWRPLARRLTVFGSYVVLTEPVPQLLDAINWTGGESIVDGRMFLHYFRTTNDGRVLMGSGSGPIGFGGRIDERFTADAPSVARAEAGLRFLLPGLADARVERAWGGPIDVSADHFPFFGTV